MSEIDATAAEPKEPSRAALSRELSDFLIEFSIALNKHGMYPDGHPTLEPAAERVLSRLEPLVAAKGMLSLGVARNQLVIEGVATDPSNPVLSELGTKLHRHHLGAITFRPNVTLDELRNVFRLVAVDPDRSGEPLGLGPADALTQWPHIALHSLSYGRLEMVDEVDEEAEERRFADDRVRATQLWLGLARAALAAEEDETAAAEDIDQDPTKVAQAIREQPRTAAYDQVIVGYMLQIAEELRVGESRESDELRRRMSKLIGSLDRDTLESLLTMGGDHGQRRQFLLNASQGMAASAVLELVRAAGRQEEQDVSNSLLRVMQKLAKHAETGTGRRRAEADRALREQVTELVADWHLRDPNPGAYTQALARMSEAESVFSVSPEQRFKPEARRIVEMALETDTMGDAVTRAAESLADQGQLKWLLQTLENSATSRVPDALWQRLATPEIVAGIVSEDPVDTDLLDMLLRRASDEVTDTLLDALTESESARTRRILLERLPEMGPQVGSRAGARLSDARWYVRRNMLKLIGDLKQVPDGIGPEEYMRDDDARVRMEALRILLERRESREQAIGSALGDTDDHVAITALRAALSACPPSVVPRVASVAVSSRSAEVRLLAVRVLGE
ncbi:MAG: hypothetical protein OER90_13085, partial [Gemmatimonadota bacterium]|nr:hypothetical protein [Gemmatimonadota bacterium]